MPNYSEKDSFAYIFLSHLIILMVTFCVWCYHSTYATKLSIILFHKNSDSATALLARNNRKKGMPSAQSCCHYCHFIKKNTSLWQCHAMPYRLIGVFTWERKKNTCFMTGHSPTVKKPKRKKHET